MPARDRGRFVLPVVVGGAALTIAADFAALLTDRPNFGPLGFVALAVPAAIIVDAIGGPRLVPAERLLASVAGAVILALLTGLAAALLSRGLDASAVSVVQLGALAAAVWLWFSRRPLPRRVDHTHVDPPGPPRRLPSRGLVGSALVVVAGLALAGGGYAIAARAAEAQPYAGFVQLWSVPPGSGGAQVVAVRNEDGGPMTCDLTLIRPGQPFLVGHVGTLADGQEWTTQLPAAQAGETGLWQLSLSCTDPSGTKLVRELTINPPA